MTDFALHRATIDAFVDGKLDAEGEADLADRVARILPFHAQLPNPIVAKLKRVLDHLGGEQALLAWLDRHPGRPRVVARLFAFIGVLDQYSAEPAVVSALREFREHTRYPQGLEKYLLPQTDDETLASLSWELESLLADDRVDEAVRVATAAVAMLEEITPAAQDRDHDVGALGPLLKQIRQELRAAVDPE
jgi:hypothetical protein